MDVHSLHMCGGATMHDGGTQRSLVSAAQQTSAGQWRSRAGAGKRVDWRRAFGGPGHQPTWTGICSKVTARRISVCPSRGKKERNQTRCLETAASKCRCRGGAGRCDAGWGARHGRTGQSSPCPGTQTSSSLSSDAACWGAGGGGGRKGCELIDRAKIGGETSSRRGGGARCGPSAVGRGLTVTGSCQNLKTCAAFPAMVELPDALIKSRIERVRHPWSTSMLDDGGK